MVFAVLLVLFVMFAFSADAHAYIDPSTGGILVQLLVGGVVGAMAVLRLCWGNVKNFFSKVFCRKSLGGACGCAGYAMEEAERAGAEESPGSSDLNRK
ncbi:hypothetical protein [Candidatus Hydrogenosomobacter endosymbioticus]|uniref:hypothetical protein n=1 Tax=Candidatus Hydrogenosomobacter endosymbioticus TaxID=2558174 RepID=UPI001F3FC790|nr:hypothetical protein [Candidatus Hydrogenosomobacter endosymbioticus]